MMEINTQRRATAEDKLVRGMGKWDLTAATINTVIGAGIFGLPSKAAALLGPYSLPAFFICAAVIALVVLCFAEVGSRFQGTGGPYLYTRAAFGPFVGFEVGWLLLIARIAAFAANCNLLIEYLSFLFPAATDSGYRIVLISTIVSGLAVVNILGIRESKYVTNFLTVAKLLPLIAFATIGLFFIQPANFAFHEVPPFGAFGGASILLIYAFVGFEMATIPGGELREPRRSLPFGLLTGLLIVTLVYITVQVVYIGTMGNIAASERPLADAANIFVGPIGASVIAAGAVISILGNSNIGLLGGSRLLFAMAEDGALPGILSRVSDRFRTPVVSTIAISLAMLLLTTQSSFLSAVAIATTARLLGYSRTCIALPVFRKRSGEAPFSLPLGPVIAALSVALLAYLLLYVDFRKEGVPILAAVSFGAVIYAFTRWRTSKQ